MQSKLLRKLGVFSKGMNMIHILIIIDDILTKNGGKYEQRIFIQFNQGYNKVQRT